MLPSLLNPLFLTGILLLSLPVLLHLFRREREGGSGFPSLMFIERIPRPLKSQLRLRHRWLLLLRCLLLLLLILAFTRPFFEQINDTSGSLDGQRDTVLLIDRSHSMALDGQWDKGIADARQLIGERLSGERIAMLAFDESSEIVLDWSSNEAEMFSALQRLQPGYHSTRIRGALEQANRMLAGSIATDKRIVLISDFPGSFFAEQAAMVSPEVDIETIVVTSSAPRTATRLLSIEPQQNSVSVEVEVSRFVQDGSLRLGLQSNDDIVAVRDLALQAGETVKHRFENLTLDASGVTGTVFIDGAETAGASATHFVYSDQQRLPVLVLTADNPRRLQSFYLQQALLQMRMPSIAADFQSWSETTAEALSQYRVIVINDAALPTGAMASALQNFVEAGGGLLLAGGEFFPNGWSADDGSILPGVSSGRSEADEVRLSVTANNHPLISGLIQQGIDFTTARFKQRHDLQAATGDRVIAEFEDGGAALIEREIGQGRVVIFPTTFDLHWNDLALQPAYLPLLQSLLVHLADYQVIPPAYTVGQTIDLLSYSLAMQAQSASTSSDANRFFTVETPSGNKLRLPRSNPLLAANEAGIYQIHRSAQNIESVDLAVNINALELDPSALDVEAWSASLQAAEAVADRYSVGIINQQLEASQNWWRLLIWCVIILLLVEYFLSNRLMANRSVTAS